MLRLSFVLYLLFTCTGIYSQTSVTRKEVSKNILKYYLKGVEFYKKNQFQNAISYFEKALQKEPRFIDAELQWASVCFETKDYTCAEQHFIRVLQLDSTFNEKVYYTLALTQYHLDHFEAAHKHINKFLSLELLNLDLLSKAKILHKSIAFADSATRNTQSVNPELLHSLNSEFSEYLPSISADGKSTVFTRRTYRGDEDLYISYFIDNEWSVATAIEELNTHLNEGSPALSQDGTKLIFTQCDSKYSLGGCDLYISEWKNESWTSPFNLGDKINSAAYESNACFAENGAVIYFSSNRKGTYGGYDLWMCRKNPDGNWSSAKNLGPVINTPGNEVCPYVHPNGKTLYFSSDYYPGMGGRDLFFSQSDEKGNWQSPVNLGFPINSKGDESSFIVFPDGKKAWMASDKKYFLEEFSSLRPNLDLYEMILPPALIVKPSTYVEIRVSDKITAKPIPAKIQIFDLSSNKIFYEKSLNGLEKLLIALPTGTDYGLHVYHKDYLFIPDQFNCSQQNKVFEPLIIHKTLEKISSISSRPVTLKNIFFESGSAVLKIESQFELNALIQLLKDNSKIKLNIYGYTDNVGSTSDNLILSQQRALSVVDYLKQKGIAADRLFYEGKGELNPISENTTEEGRLTNRRIEFSIQPE